MKSLTSICLIWSAIFYGSLNVQSYSLNVCLFFYMTTGILNVKRTILQDSSQSWKPNHYHGGLLILIYWLTVLKMSLPLEECIQIINVIGTSHCMVIFEVAIWRKARRYSFQPLVTWFSWMILLCSFSC